MLNQFKPAVVEGTEEATGEDASNRTARILVVDDDPNIRKVLSHQLRANQYEVETAADGIEALAKIETGIPDLILLDLMMPHMDGYEVNQNLKQNYRTCNIPVIIVTAKGELQEKVKGLKGGANDYITKPFAMSEVLLRVQNVLNWSQLQRQSNPLTGLPGNVSIDREIGTRIGRGASFAFVYADIDNFKAYNDYYGYNRGDEAIRLTAKVIMQSVEQNGNTDDFVGHIGGDDFVIVTNPEQVDVVCRAVVENFDDSVKELFADEDVARGYVEVTNRRGELVRFPLLTITLAVVTSDQCPMTHVAKVSDVASELKRYGKGFQGSVVVKERRRE